MKKRTRRKRKDTPFLFPELKKNENKNIKKLFRTHAPFASRARSGFSMFGPCFVLHSLCVCVLFCFFVCFLFFGRRLSWFFIVSLSFFWVVVDPWIPLECLCIHGNERVRETETQRERKRERKKLSLSSLLSLFEQERASRSIGWPNEAVTETDGMRARRPDPTFSFLPFSASFFRYTTLLLLNQTKQNKTTKNNIWWLFDCLSFSLSTLVNDDILFRVFLFYFLLLFFFLSVPVSDDVGMNPPINLPASLESLPRAEHFPTQRHRWNTNEV